MAISKRFQGSGGSGGSEPPKPPEIAKENEMTTAQTPDPKLTAAGDKGPVKPPAKPPAAAAAPPPKKAPPPKASGAENAATCKRLAAARALILKHTGKKNVTVTKTSMPHVGSGSFLLDHLIGGSLAE